jgi:hypothetical protein
MSHWAKYPSKSMRPNKTWMRSHHMRKNPSKFISAANPTCWRWDFLEGNKKESVQVRSLMTSSLQVIWVQESNLIYIQLCWLRYSACWCWRTSTKSGWTGRMDLTCSLLMVNTKQMEMSHLMFLMNKMILIPIYKFLPSMKKCYRIWSVTYTNVVCYS